jgi:AcrR family transcriptional regulator
MDTREAILEKALAFFASRGYDAVGVQEIVEAAGVTKPTLYHYFGNKLGLLRTLLESHYEALNGHVGSAAEYHGDLPLTLRRIASAYFGFMARDPVFYRMQLSLYFAPDHSEAFKEVVRLNDEQFRIIEGVFLQASQDHGNMKGRQRLYAASFLGMINNCIGLALNGFLTLDDALLERAVHQFEHGIYS